MPPLLLGHRGARAFRKIPENTLASFELCMQQGCDGFEFDVRLSRDGQAVVCHDATVGGVEIADTASKDLRLPLLEDVLRQFAGRAFLDIELKVAGLELMVIALVRKYPPSEGFVVSSFLPGVLGEINRLNSGIPLGLLCDTREQLRDWNETPAGWVVPHFDLADRRLVELIHAAGKKVMVWTVNRAERMRLFSEWGVDAVISDETELLVHSLR